MLTARGVGYVLPDGRTLFDGVDVHVEAGQAVAICGPSGVGKSTLLAILGRLLPPHAGTVTIEHGDGEPIAWVLQTLNHLGARTALDNATMNHLVDGGPRREARRRARDVLDSVGLGDHATTRARKLSGGELQRLTVARALSSRRPIILADEPTNQLDASNARTVMRLLAATAVEEGRAVVIVTHDVDALPDACQRMNLTSAGLAAVTGSPA